MSPLLRRQPAPRPSDDAAARHAVADYLAVSRSPLRLTDPEWFEVAKSAAWDRLCAAVGIGPPEGDPGSR